QAITNPQTPSNSSGNGGAQPAGNQGLARQKPIIDGAVPINAVRVNGALPGAGNANSSGSGTLPSQPGGRAIPIGAGQALDGAFAPNQPPSGSPAAAPPPLGGNGKPGPAIGGLTS